MSQSATRGIPALLGEARRALTLNQEELGALLGSSKRTVQRLETGRSSPDSQDLARLAAHVHPKDAALAAELARRAGETLESLGIVASAPAPAQPSGPQPAAPPLMPRHLAVDAVVCVASDAAGAMPAAIRGVLLAAFRRARELGLSYDEVERALEAALRPPAAEPGKARR